MEFDYVHHYAVREETEEAYTSTDGDHARYFPTYEEALAYFDTFKTDATLFLQTYRGVNVILATKPILLR